MSKQLNIQPASLVSGSPVTVLSGAFASLSGPVGFTATQPRITVKKVTVSAASSSSFALYKNGVVVLEGSNTGTVAASFVYDVEIVLDAADTLAGNAPSGGSAIVNISADIEFS